MRPDGETLRLKGRAGPLAVGNGPKPATGYDHPWQFMRAEVFDAVHARFSHFGVYEPRVDSRSQYYAVEIEEGAELLAAAGPDATWADLDGTLTIDKAALAWDRVNPVLENEVSARDVAGVALDLLGAVLSLASGQLSRRAVRDLVRDLTGTTFVRTRHKSPLFNEHFLFRLIHREPLGWLLVHRDKRDDDLLPFADLASTGRLRLHGVAGPGDLTAVPGRTVRLALGGHRRVLSPPRVARAEILVRRAPGRRPREVRLRFRFVRCAQERFNNGVEENIWRVCVGALSSVDGPVVPIVDVLRHGAFEPEPGRPGWHVCVWSLEGEPPTPWRPTCPRRVA